MYIKNFLLFGILGLSLLAACDSSRVVEEYVDYTEGNWYYDSVANFEVDIRDTTQDYNIYFNVRNSIAYPFYNLYIQYELSDSSGRLLRSNLQEFTLMHAKTGEPFGETASPAGEGIGLLYTHQFPLLNTYKFESAGTYTFRFNQYMQPDTLPGIYNVGIRVEKAKK
ncbi:gliding motility lipoprotein GldH [Algivirga pacifica]|uniref:Gliding motility lipoprotein GldH n=1 Tax=Algivirga pacifica TaxID=1162670 RepID=A0ABP9D9K5_9BACT